VLNRFICHDWGDPFVAETYYSAAAAGLINLEVRSGGRSARIRQIHPLLHCHCVIDAVLDTDYQLSLGSFVSE
ncbi:MAG: hypothetical protein NTX56_00865, partial [Proteobacteria bacterium]|nr:hypothetical protein [Pseudomonadota bacterium]